MPKRKGTAFIDGSHNPTTGMMGMAVILMFGKGRPHRLAFRHEDKTGKGHGANIAELLAAKTAIRAARSLGITDLTIYHDWNGVAFFSHPSNIKKDYDGCQVYRQYAEFVEERRKEMRIQFEWVQGHSGVERNELADKMARRALAG